jgi:hypothetical protein
MLAEQMDVRLEQYMKGKWKKEWIVKRMGGENL